MWPRTAQTIKTPKGFEIAAGLKIINSLHPPLILDPSDTENIDLLKSTLYDLRRWSVQIVAIRLKAGGRREQEIRQETWAGVSSFLGILYNSDILVPILKSQSKIDEGLKLIFDPVYKFPPVYVKTSRAIYDKLENECWGADETDSGEPDTFFKSPISPMAPSVPCAPKLNAAPHPTSSPDNNIITAASSTVRIMPADSDPIYGLNGPMHHILRFNSGKKTSYSIDPSWVRPNAKFFGAGDFVVGQCWASQMALLRDGAHGSNIAGISGNITVGAFSIVISGLYDDLDIDYGNELFYSGSNSHENTSPVPATSNGTKALEVSTTSQQPVRVFRSDKAQWLGRPIKGIRYDGLYYVVSVSNATNCKGGAYKRFRVIRDASQPPINTSKPTTAEATLFSRVQDGYTKTRA